MLQAATTTIRVILSGDGGARGAIALRAGRNHATSMTATIALVDPPARIGRSQRRHCNRRGRSFQARQSRRRRRSGRAALHIYAAERFCIPSYPPWYRRCPRPTRTHLFGCDQQSDRSGVRRVRVLLLRGRGSLAANPSDAGRLAACIGPLSPRAESQDDRADGFRRV
jgi:hypothetical protein